MGAYRRGSDPRLDEAIDRQPRFQTFLQQDMFQSFSIEESLKGIQQALREPQSPKTAAPVMNVAGVLRHEDLGGRA